jgi:hypothetical protein
MALTCAGCGEPITSDQSRIALWSHWTDGVPDLGNLEFAWHSLDCLDRWRADSTT